MFKTILVPCSGNADDEPAFKTALDAARVFGGHLLFLHVRPDAAEFAAALSGDGMAGTSANLIDFLETEAEKRERAAFKSYQSFVKRAKLASGTAAGKGKVSARWIKESGNEGEWLAEHARSADLIVAARPSNSGEARDAFEAALLHSGKPVLISGKNGFALGTIAVAWKPTREAAHAVAATLPLIESAKRVVVLVVAEGDSKDRESAERMADALRRHNKKIDLRLVRPGKKGVGKALLSACEDAGADLLVMGGYGHTRLREWVFGGVTEHVLQNAEIPVVMAH